MQILFTGISRISFVKVHLVFNTPVTYFLKYFRAKFREILISGSWEIARYFRGGYSTFNRKNIADSVFIGQITWSLYWHHVCDFFPFLLRARENCVRPSVNILARQKSKARSKIQIVQNNLHIAETKRKELVLNSTEILQLNWNCTRHVIYARLCVHGDCVHGDFVHDGSVGIR